MKGFLSEGEEEQAGMGGIKSWGNAKPRTMAIEPERELTPKGLSSFPVYEQKPQNMYCRNR